MIIDNETWGDIIAETRAGIDRWNTRAAEYGLKDSFRCIVRTGTDDAVLLTKHLPDGDGKAVVRERATGKLRRAKLIVHNGQLTGVSLSKSDPKGWHELAGKPVGEIVEELKLLDFLMADSASFISFETLRS
jgi:hypothetical protein